LYFIKEKADSAQGFPLTRLFEEILKVFYRDEEPQFCLAKVRGYGKSICRLEDEVLRRDKVRVSKDELQRIVNSEDEWFYDLMTRKQNFT
jgi:hypothetical protein